MLVGGRTGEHCTFANFFGSEKCFFKKEKDKSREIVCTPTPTSTLLCSLLLLSYLDWIEAQGDLSHGLYIYSSA